MSGDDIVIGNVKYRRIQGVWTMTPNGTRGMFHIDPRRRELLDEIERLRAERTAERALADQLADAHYSDGVTWGCGCAVNDDGILACDSAGRPCPLRRPASTTTSLAAYQEARRER